MSEDLARKSVAAFTVRSQAARGQNTSNTALLNFQKDSSMGKFKQEYTGTAEAIVSLAIGNNLNQFDYETKTITCNGAAASTDSGGGTSAKKPAV